MKKPENITHLRLLNQQISKTKFKNPKDLVGHMGAMQAQDYAMAKWAVGVRLPGFTEKKIEAALDKGEIIRTHVLRPTWHFISAEDVYWMLELSEPQIGAALRARHKELELSDKILAKTNTIIAKLLEGEKYLTRDELVTALEHAKIATDNNRSSHILMRAELDGLICSGKITNHKQTYALLSDRVKKKKSITRQEALAKLALCYFSGHGPATLADFTWWSGLPVKDARLGLELVKEKFISEKLKDEIYWFPASLKVPAAIKPLVHLLPAFDEFLISYKNRTASLLAEHHKKAFSSNGIFWPTIVVNGHVTGLWKRSVKKDTVTIETNFFHPHDAATIKLLEKAADAFGDFLGKKAQLTFSI
jgi:hypothetical protein